MIKICLLLACFTLAAFAAEEHPCGDFKTEIPKEWIQGTVAVPENPDFEEGKKINVFYYGQIQKDKTPVVFFNGGPGQASHNAFYILLRDQKIFDGKKNLSFIFIDQRGTGCSDFYPQGSSEEVLERLMYYGSRGIVGDAEIIRKKILGDKPWIVFGQSYGAHIVHKYVTLYPKSIKAGFAHANTLNTSPYDRFKFRIASQVRVMQEYLRQYPGDARIVELLNDKLDMSVCFNYGNLNNSKACGYEISEDLISTYLGSSDNWPKMHQWLNIMADKDELNPEGLALYVSIFFEDQPVIYSKRWSERVISWVDRNVSPYDGRHCTATQYDLFQEDIELSNNGFTECSSILQNKESNYDNYGRKMVKYLPQDKLTVPEFKSALVNNPKLNFYLYSGQKDPFVPVESFKEELNALQDLPNVHYKNFLGTGHDGYHTEAQLWQEMIKEAKFQ